MDTPSGAVTFLFTDVEGSTRLWAEHTDAMNRAITRHDEVMRAAIESHCGYVFATGGDSFAVAFSSPPDGVAAALDAQARLHAEPWEGLPDGAACANGSPHRRGERTWWRLLRARGQPGRSGDVGGVGRSDPLHRRRSPRSRVRHASRSASIGCATFRRRSSLHQVVVPGLPIDFPPPRTLDVAPVDACPTSGRASSVDCADIDDGASPAARQSPHHAHRSRRYGQDAVGRRGRRP